MVKSTHLEDEDCLRLTQVDDVDTFLSEAVRLIESDYDEVVEENDRLQKTMLSMSQSQFNNVNLAENTMSGGLGEQAVELDLRINLNNERRSRPEVGDILLFTKR